MWHLSYVTFHVSPVTCHLSSVTCHQLKKPQLWLFELVTGDRWQVTGDRWDVKRDIWQVSHDFLILFWYWCYHPHTYPAYIKATMPALKDATWSTSGTQVLHMDLTFPDHYVKGKVFIPLLSGVPELQAGSSVIFRASPQKQGDTPRDSVSSVCKILTELAQWADSISRL